MRRILQMLSLAAWLLAVSASAQGEIPRFAADECPEFIQRLAAENDAAITCGYLLVAEYRADARNSRHIQLFVARIAAGSRRHSAPLLFLEGGPGDAASDRIGELLGSFLHQELDIIIMDQRGSGLSRPALNCHERDQRRSADTLRWVRACFHRLSGAGIALHAYTSASSAADIQDLLRALAIPEVDVYGFSYGSRLALTFLRDYPGSVRSLLLDATAPPHVNIMEGRAGAAFAALEQLFHECAGTPACQRAFNTLRADFYETVKRLNAAPARLEFGDGGSVVEITGDGFVYALHASLLDYQRLPFIPAQIANAAKGDYSDMLAAANRLDRRDSHSEGLYFSVLCAEELPFNSEERAHQDAAAIPPPVQAALSKLALRPFAECRAWEVPRTPEFENQPVRSDVPALLLSGSYDALAPSAWAAEAQRWLDNAWHVVFPHTGHGSLFAGACAERIARAFLSAPRQAPPLACLQEQAPPDFHIPA